MISSASVLATLAVGFQVGLDVLLHGERHVCVPDALAQRLPVDLGVPARGRVAVPHVMQIDRRQPGRRGELFETSRDRVRMRRPAVLPPRSPADPSLQQNSASHPSTTDKHAPKRTKGINQRVQRIAGPALPAPGSASEGLPGTPAPSHRVIPADQVGKLVEQSGAAGSRRPRLRLSGSRPPRLGRPSGPSHAIGFAAPSPRITRHRRAQGRG